MQDRQQHRNEVQAFLQKHFSSQHWKFSLPGGWGNETYFALSDGNTCFVKLGVQAARYQAMAGIGLTPPVLACGFLDDGTSIIVQPFISGRRPTWKDFQTHLEKFAAAVKTAHNSPEVKHVLPEPPSDSYRDAGMGAFVHLQQSWERCKAQVPKVAGFIDESLDAIRRQVSSFEGSGLVASHNDICNANWILSPGGQLYLIDLESMSLDDPAFDIGALLWWYYPPGLRARFTKIVGHAGDPTFETRMRVRMAMHCLSITLPRQGSFDEFEPASFTEGLTDFRAILAGKENPHGYED